MAKQEEKQEIKQEHSKAYKLGYASTLNSSKLGFSLLNLADKAKDKKEILQLILDYSKAYDHARDRLKSPQKQQTKDEPEKKR